MPTACSVLGLVGLMSIVALSYASAQSVTGGCAVTINGQAPGKLTRSHPLVLGEHDTVVVVGQIPPKVESAKRSKKVKSSTAIKVTGIEGVAGITMKTIKATGPDWGAHIKVDPYLRYGVGLYRIEVLAAGTGGWPCRASGYVRLKGSPLSKPVGRAAAILVGMGIAGALVSTKAIELKRPDGEWDKATDAFADAGCMVIALMIFYTFVSFPAVLGATAGATRAYPGRNWGHGHTGLGFFSGLMAGIGASVLAQQYAVWPLTRMTAIGLPLAFAVLVAVRAHIGRPYRVGAKTPTS